jgi:hypothetical protein
LKFGKNTTQSMEGKTIIEDADSSTSIIMVEYDQNISILLEAK